MNPVLFSIGSFNIYSYSVYLTAGCLLALAWAMRESRERGLDWKIVPMVGFSAIISGLIGARALYVSIYPAEFANDLLDIFRVWNGGLVYSGAFIFGSSGAMLYLKSQKQKILPWLDSFAPAVALGQSVGRLGCFFAGCCYGKPTELPWGITFTNTDSLAPSSRLCTRPRSTTH